MTILSTALITIAAFLAGLFTAQPEQNSDLDFKIEIVDIKENVRNLYASIARDQEIIFQTLIKDVDKNCTLPHGTTPLSVAIEQKRYFYAQQLLRHDFTATLKDLERCQHMQSQETDPVKKDQATVFVQFLKKHLEEIKVLPCTEQTQRGKNDGAAPAAKSSSEPTAPLSFSIDYQFLQATERGDTAAMSNLLAQGANPNAIINCSRALDVSIARAQLESLDLLLQQNIKITNADIERAATYHFIHETNKDLTDRISSNNLSTATGFVAESFIRKRVLEKLITQARKQASAAEQADSSKTLSSDKKA
ncbi:MAG: hypothetical protein NTZ68_00165 [Candidatus Dependentiae bacterium]|nr:hypothetical protein [Candidatus Dependentiae bacterium]